MECLSQDGVVGFLGHVSLARQSTVTSRDTKETVPYLSCCIEGGDVVLHDGYNPLLGILTVRNSGEGKKVITAASSGIGMTLTHLAKKSGCAKISAYISRRDLFSKMKVGSVTLVRSMPSLTWDSMCMMRLLF